MNRIFFKKKFFFVSVFFFVCFVFICVKKTPETPQKKKRMFPSGFTEAEIEFAVSVGTQAVYQTRKHNAAEPTTDFASAMKEAFNSEVKAENEGLRAALAQRVDDQKLADLQKDLENVRADLAAKRADAQQMLNLAEAERLKSHSELERLAKQLSEERTHAETLKKELAILKISTCKGEVGEESVFEALSSSGLFAVRVGGNDQHHGHYHDVLCAETTLMRSDDLVFPRYATDDAEPRLSIEVKFHKNNQKMTGELEKFLNRRALMLSEGSAECFLFAATASIPGQAVRTRIQIQRREDNYVVSALLGACDLKAEEISVTARLVLAMQQRILKVRRQPLQDAAQEAMRSWSEELLGRLRAQLDASDEQLRISEQLVAHAKQSRLENVLTLLRHFDVLLKTGMLEVDSSTQELADALEVVMDETAKKPANDRILRFTTELKSARLYRPPRTMLTS